MLECDDGNLIDGDGCSKDCKIEEGYVCSGGSVDSPDKCINMSPLTMNLRYIYDQGYFFKIDFNR